MSTEKNKASTLMTGFCLASLAVDKAAAKEGLWFPFMNGVEFKIAKANSQGERTALANLYKANQAMIDSETPEGNMLAEQLTISVEAKFRLVDWRNVLDESGEEVPYSAEKSEEYMNIEEVRNFVNAKASAYEPWRVSSVKATVEKLKK